MPYGVAEIVKSAPQMAQRLTRLAHNPPQALLLEGGDERQRLALGLYWAMLANCQARGDDGAPCMECLACRQIAANENVDLWIYDGRISNRQDEEAPGPIKAMRMENIRDLKSAIATRPHGDGKRVAIFQGISLTREEAQNSLLKILEEPGDTTLFVLLVPQREQILPTLVSRSFCLTLPWQGARTSDGEMVRWEDAIAVFLRTGQGLLDNLAARGALDQALAEQILLSVQGAFIRAMSEGQSQNAGSLQSIFSAMRDKPEMASVAGQWLVEAREMLLASVTPARALEAFFTKLFLLLSNRA